MGWDVTLIRYADFKPVAASSLYTSASGRLRQFFFFLRGGEYLEVRLTVARHVYGGHGLGRGRYAFEVARRISDLFACQTREHTRPFGEKVLFSAPNRHLRRRHFFRHYLLAAAGNPRLTKHRLLADNVSRYFTLTSPIYAHFFFPQNRF